MLCKFYIYVQINSLLLHAPTTKKYHELRRQGSLNSSCIQKLEDLPDGWLVVFGFNATLTAKVISWRSVTYMCFPRVSHTSSNTTFFPKPLTTFLTCFSSGERQKYARKKVRLNWALNSQPPGHESDSLTTEPLGRAGPA